VSQENVELVRTGLDALNRGDWDAVLELLDPEVKWETTGQFVEGGVYRGREGVREFLETLGEEFEEFRSGVERVTEVGDLVVAEIRTSGIGKRSGARVEVEFTILIYLSEGRITRLRNFMDRAKALEAAALRD
jgi:ketosteroid isomerase-like protein